MSDWTTQSLEQAGVILIDCVHATPEARPQGYPYVAIPQMKDGRIDFISARKISREDFEQWTRKAKPQKHDIVLSRRTNPGVTAPVDDNCEFALGQNLVLLRADGASVLPEFLRWLVSCPAWWEQIAKFNNVGAVFDSLRCADVPRFELPIPPKSEQAKISTLLGALDDKIELNRRMNETLEAMARTIFKDWFVDFGPTRAKIEGRAPYLAPDIWSLFPDRIDDEGRPEGWELGCLRDFTGLQNGYAFKSADWQDHGVPVVKIGSVKSAVVDLDQVTFVTNSLADEQGEFRLAVGDILVGLTGYVGETGRIPPTENVPLLNQRVGRFLPKAGAYPFVYACVRGTDFKKFAECKSHGSAQANVSTRDLLTYEITRAPDHLMKAFANVVQSLLDQSLANLGEISTLADMRNLLLPKLMSGEIRIKDAEKMVGEAV